MEDFIDQNLPQFCIEQLSTCHMYLQVTTLVEITNQEYGWGTTPTNTHQPLWKGLTNISTSLLLWPNVPRLSSSCWHIFGPLPSAPSTWAPRMEHASDNLWVLFFSHLVYKHSPSLSTCVALKTMCCHTSQKFSHTVPTSLLFTCSPITATDPTIGQIMTTFEPKQCKTASLQLKCENKRKMH